jgi:hypothetical protein
VLEKFLKQRKVTTDKTYARAATRSATLGKGELLDSMDVTGSELARVLSAYRRNPDSSYTYVIAEGAKALSAMADELYKRSK